MTSLQKPKVLVLGVSGQIGRFVLEHLDKYPETLNVRITGRRPEQVATLQKQGRDAVLLDLDNPTTFAGALHGVDRVFLLTGYTVAMLAQSKTFVDAARKARVQHIVHLGVFGRWDCTDPHIAWHQLVETYIEASGIRWTHIHPNMFMEQIPKFMKIRNDRFPIFWGPGRMGWIAAQDSLGTSLRRWNSLATTASKPGTQRECWSSLSNSQTGARVTSEPSETILPT